LDDFSVERHTLFAKKITQVFHHSSPVVMQGLNSKGALIQGEGAAPEEVQGIDLSHLGRVQRFPSDPVDRKARCIFFLVPC
jgi:hypothetical protein